MCVVVALLLSSKFIQAQEFSSSEKISEKIYKVEVIFKEINSVKLAEQIIHTLKKIEGVDDVELFYPTTTHGYLFVSSTISAKIIIDRLSQINVELDPKSFKN